MVKITSKKAQEVCELGFNKASEKVAYLAKAMGVKEDSRPKFNIPEDISTLRELSNFGVKKSSEKMAKFLKRYGK